jgi:ubiquinone/menaquinone biosynthesis C-methylase UbiE
VLAVTARQFLGATTPPPVRSRPRRDRRRDAHELIARSSRSAYSVAVWLTRPYCGRVSEQLWSAYDQMGSDFLRHAADSAYNAHYDRPAMLAALGPVEGMYVLDAACGPGLYTRELLARGAQVTAFDASEVMVGIARGETRGQAEIGRAVLGEPLPYADNAFDRIVCALAIHYAGDRRAAFAEFYRVLRPSGVLLISTGHPFTDWLRGGGSYFDTTLQTEIWHTSAGDLDVSFWREPLSVICGGATSAGFLIEQLIEPQPAPSMREQYPEDFDQLREKPGFLILRLIKPPVSSA